MTCTAETLARLNENAKLRITHVWNGLEIIRKIMTPAMKRPKNITVKFLNLDCLREASNI